MSTKQVIVMRKDLGMRKGKMIAQGAHASMAWLTRKLAMTVYPVKTTSDGQHFWNAGATLSQVEREWLESSFKKICVYVNSEEELFTIVYAARLANVVVHSIQDSGLTEFNGPTWTCCAIGPDYDERIDPITGHLPLL